MVSRLTKIGFFWPGLKPTVSRKINVASLNKWKALIPNLHPTAAQILVAADDSIKDDLDGPNDLLAQDLGATFPASLWAIFIFDQKQAILAQKQPKNVNFGSFYANLRYFFIIDYDS